MPDQDQLLNQMIAMLAPAVGAPAEAQASTDLAHEWRGLVNQLVPEKISGDYLELEDRYLDRWWAGQRVRTLADCQQTREPDLFLDRGDLCQLAVGAIVNAANSGLVGCFIPNHPCLDNAVHTFAGARLRLACQQIITRQGRKEAVGQAKITAAYHLPSDYVIHTVGPYVRPGQRPSPIREHLLGQSYRACLQLAAAKGIRTIAFPCLSTGQFGFPNRRAAQIAVATVREWQRVHPKALRVIFSVYTPKDQLIYQRLLLAR